MFVKDMLRCLLWFVNELCAKNLVAAPSWSWVSCCSPLKRPPSVQFGWNRYSALTEDYPNQIEETSVNLVDLMEIPESPELQHEASTDPRYGLLLHSPLITADLVINQYFKPKLTAGGTTATGGVRQVDFKYRLVRDGQKREFVFDFLLHVGLGKMKSGSEVLLLAIARTGTTTSMPNCGLVLRPVGANESGTHVCMRIGMFGDFSEHWQPERWFEGAPAEDVLIL